MSDETDRDEGDELQLIRNELKRIKTDTANINRIMTLSSSPVIVQELKKAISGSKVRAAILTLTKEEISATDLSRRLGIDPANLAMYMRPLIDPNKGFVTVTEVGAKRYFQRAQLVDLVGFEMIPEFVELLKQWEAGRTKQSTTPAPPAPDPSQAQGQTNVS